MTFTHTHTHTLTQIPFVQFFLYALKVVFPFFSPLKSWSVFDVSVSIEERFCDFWKFPENIKGYYTGGRNGNLTPPVPMLTLASWKCQSLRWGERADSQDWRQGEGVWVKPRLILSADLMFLTFELFHDSLVLDLSTLQYLLKTFSFPTFQNFSLFLSGVS